MTGEEACGGFDCLGGELGLHLVTGCGVVLLLWGKARALTELEGCFGARIVDLIGLMGSRHDK